MTLTLGFSGGVMILISFVELLQGGIEAIGFAPAHLAFFGRMVAMFLIDALIPHDYMAEHHHTEEERREGQLLKTGLFVALGIAIHNIPEGLAVSAPVYAATGSRGKAFWWSFLSGVAEPIGAGLAALVLSITEEFLDPDYPLARTTIRWAEEAGFELAERYGNWWVYTLNFRKRT